MTPVSFRTPQRIMLGGGVRHQLGAAAAELSLRRPLIVTDAFHAANGVAEELAASLEDAGLVPATFSETVPDPTISSVTAAVAAASAHEADVVVGIGGGSPLDTAKAVALLATRGGDMRQYRAPLVNAGDALPIIAVPTTAGSGSEATQFTIITDDENAEKMLCIGPAFLPRIAVVDYELTLTMPPRLTADTGVDALTHAIEAYVSRRANELSDVFALRAMSLVGANLVDAYRDGGDARARENMMLASLLAGIAFSNSSVALVHGMSRPLGAHFGIPHGLSNALLFAEVTRYSLSGAEERYADCARALGVADTTASTAAAGRALVDALERFNNVLAVPNLADLGVRGDDWRASLDVMASQALASGSPANNPVVPTERDIRDMYERIFATGSPAS